MTLCCSVQRFSAILLCTFGVQVYRVLDPTTAKRAEFPSAVWWFGCGAAAVLGLGLKKALVIVAACLQGL